MCKDAAKHLTIHSIALTAKSYPASYVNIAKDEKLQYSDMGIHNSQDIESA